MPAKKSRVKTDERHRKIEGLRIMFQGIGRFEQAQDGYAIVALCIGKIHDFGSCDGPVERKFYACVAIEPRDYAFFRANYQDGQSSHFDIYGRELMREWLRPDDAGPPAAFLNHLIQKHDVDFTVGQDYIDQMAALASHAPLPVGRSTGTVQELAAH